MHDSPEVGGIVLLIVLGFGIGGFWLVKLVLFTDWPSRDAIGNAPARGLRHRLGWLWPSRTNRLRMRRWASRIRVRRRLKAGRAMELPPEFTRPQTRSEATPAEFCAACGLSMSIHPVECAGGER